MSGPTLTAPFANTSELTKGGRTFTYIPAGEVVDRLNACLGYGSWSYEVRLVHLDENFVVVHGRLSALGAVFEQFGGQRINKSKQGEPIDLGDDLKGSASDALKKAAQMIGVGLYLSLGRSPHKASAGGEGARGSALDTPGGDSSGSESSTPARAAPAAAEEEPAPRTSSAKSSGGDDQGEKDGNSSQRGTSAVPTGKPYQAEKPLSEARKALGKS